MKNYLLRLVVFVILLFGHPLQAEDTKDITYLRKLAATTKDSLKLMRIYSALGWELGFEDLREGLKITEEALRLAIKYNDKAMQAQVYDAIGTFYHDMGDAERAVEIHNKAIDLFKSLPPVMKQVWEMLI